MANTLADAWVQFTDHGDGSADFTVSLDDEDFKFSAVVYGDTVAVQYEETLSWRGVIRVAEPREEVFRRLMTSDEMTAFLEDNGAASVKRAKR